MSSQDASKLPPPEVPSPGIRHDTVTSHSERSLLDLLGCEEKEVNLEASSGEPEAVTKSGSSGLPVEKDTLKHAQINQFNPNTQNNKRYWNTEEDNKLTELVQKYGARNWKRIASFLDHRTDVQCLHRWQKVLNPSMVKGPWSKAEDMKLAQNVLRFGAKNWSHIAQALPGRIGK